MSWRRGFFRVWVLGSALFVVAVAAINYSEIRAQFDAAAFRNTLNTMNCWCRFCAAKREVLRKQTFSAGQRAT